MQLTANLQRDYFEAWLVNSTQSVVKGITWKELDGN